MHSVVDFQVNWPKLLFKSRLQIPCRDIIHVATSISRRDINLSLCSFQLMSSHVATSLYAFAGFNWSLMMSRHQSLVPTSAQVFCSLQLVLHDVATSISCRDISLYLWRLHWLFSVSRLQSSVATTASVKSASSFQTCHSFKVILLLRPPSLVATSTLVAITRCCRDIIPLASR